MLSYERMDCRLCGEVIEPDSNVLLRLGRRRTAAKREDCIYRCTCGASYSNAVSSGARVLMSASPKLNVPQPVQAGVAAALAGAVNETNLKNKAAKFCFETSEDAVTWTVFKGLQQAGRLAAAAPGATDDEPCLLLWGAALSGERATQVAAELRRVSLELGEDPRRLTEPDVILSWGELLVFVEAKYKSANDKKPGYAQFPRYTEGRPDLFTGSPHDVAAAGYYELTRNWRIGVEVAERLGVSEFLLVNLGAKALAQSSSEFAATIQQTPQRRFSHRRWAQVLDAASPLEPWLTEYASTRKLQTR
jgi:hypothetical protein